MEHRDTTESTATDDAVQGGVRLRAVRGVDALCARAREVGRIDLPTVTREELRTMGDVGVVPDEADLVWWRELTDDTREQVASAAARGLLARQLVQADPSDGRLPGELAPELVLTLATRRNPAAVLSVAPADGPAVTEPRLQGYVLPDDAESDTAGSVRLILLEQVHDGLHRLELCSAPAAADRLVRWLTTGTGAERILEIVWAGAGEAARLPVRRGEVATPASVLALLEAPVGDTEVMASAPRPGSSA